MSTDGQTSDPRASLAPRHRGGRRRRHPRGDARRRARRGRRRSRAVDGRDLRLRSRPPGPPARRVARDGRGRDGRARHRRQRPGRSVHRRPRSRGSRPSTARPRRPDGSGFVGAYLPLVVGSGGVDTVLGCDRLRLAGAARARRDRTGDADRAGRAGRAGHRPDAPGLDSRRALRMVRADGPHRPADRARQRAHGRARPRARAGTRRPPGQRGLVRDVRRRRLPGDQPRRAVTRPATTSCVGSPRSSPSRSGWSTPSGGSVATSSCWSLPARPARWWRDGSSTGSRHSPRSAAGRSRSRPAWRASRSTATDAAA